MTPHPQDPAIHEIESVSSQRARKSIKKEFAIFERGGLNPISVWPTKKLAQGALRKLTPPLKVATITKSSYGVRFNFRSSICGVGKCH